MVKETLNPPCSHYLLTADLSQEIDRRTIEEMDIDGFTLMEVAGSSAAKIILREYPDLSHGVFLCGKGNNGGDALVVARYLIQNDINISLVFLSGTDDLSEDAGKNLQLLKSFDHHNKLTIFEHWDDFKSPEHFDFIIDGMLGTGLDSDVRSDYAKAVHWANDQSQPVFAMDTPTGLHADTGQIMGCAIQARDTFAFGGRKQGFYLEDGPEISGRIHYCELPFPNKFKESCRTFLLDESWVSLESPTTGRHKYDSGVLYIVAGSEGLTGAAIMAARSAWAEGLGAVILICPRGVLDIYEQNLPSIIKKPVGSRDDYNFRQEHAKEVLSILDEKEGNVLVGPGLGREPSTVDFVQQFLAQNTRDAVIDADGLWCLSQLDDWTPPENVHWILTPHPGELNRLLPETDILTDTDRLSAARKLASQKNITLLSKGMPGIIGTSSGACYVTDYNTHYFARAGSGDVLAGKVGAYLALDNSSETSCLKALLNGKKKLDYFLNHQQGLPEPKDFI